MFDWNDLRYFLAVARTGSTLAASKKLRVSQATVSRRVGVLEDALGAKLFVRAPTGYTLTSRGEAVVPSAEAVEAAVASLTGLVDAETRRLTGAVKITTVEGAANSWIFPALGAFREIHPDVRAEVLINERNLDLARGDADIAIRFGARPTQENLVVRHLLDLDETVYAPRDLVTRLGLPSSFADLRRYPRVGLSDEIPGPINRWYDSVAPDADIVHRANTVSGVISGVRAGLGAAVMPCLMGDTISGLVRLFPPIPELTTPGWLVTTDVARQQPHIRALIDFMVDHILQSIVATEARFAIARAA
jgi:DNA-binding transcriptional LysR family regulator